MYVGTYLYLICMRGDSLHFTVDMFIYGFPLYQEGVAGTSAKSYLAALPYTEIAINGSRRP